MDGVWTCSQCETLNENTDKCIVCGMTYQASVNAAKKADNIKIEKTIHSHIKINQSNIRFNFPDEPINMNMQTKERKKNVLSIISFLAGIMGILMIVLLEPFGGVWSLGAVITGIISLKKKENKVLAIAGIVAGAIGITIVGSIYA